MGKHYFTFASYPTTVQVIHAGDPETAREKMFSSYGHQWSMQYTESEWQQSINEGYFKNARFLKPIHC